MNNARRNELKSVITLLQKAEQLRSEAAELLTQIQDDEQDYFDNMPESLQGGDKGTAAEEAISALEDVGCDLDGFDIDGIVSRIEDIINA